MRNFIKTVRIGTAQTPNGRSYSVFCEVKFVNGKLSICGVEGPTRGGNCLGSCGQIDMHEWNIRNYAKGWSAELERKFREVWKRWHLNDMRAECSHQRERGENWKNNPSAVCPECGWKLGHGWNKEPVPQDVVDFLISLPETDRKPAWV